MISGEEKNLLPPLDMVSQFLNCPSCSLVTVLNEISCLPLYWRRESKVWHRTEVSGQIHTPAPRLPGKESPVPTVQEISLVLEQTQPHMETETPALAMTQIPGSQAVANHLNKISWPNFRRVSNMLQHKLLPHSNISHVHHIMTLNFPSN